MKKWDEHDRPIFMDVAWTTEKSIEDELDRTSKAEIMTMVISYLVMFVYVAFALGKIKASMVGCFVSFHHNQYHEIIKYINIWHFNDNFLF